MGARFSIGFMLGDKPRLRNSALQSKTVLGMGMRM
jgi:hypothetical protein